MKKKISQKQTYPNSYTNAPMLIVGLKVDNVTTLQLNGLIDTGSTFTILSEEIANKHFPNIDSSKPLELRGASGLVNLHLIGRQKINIVGYNHFDIDIYTGIKIESSESEEKIDIVLGLSFFEKCSSLWLNAANKTYMIEFWG